MSGGVEAGAGGCMGCRCRKCREMEVARCEPVRDRSGGDLLSGALREHRRQMHAAKHR